ncbi:hypothetical protein [Winogradskyella algicola]|uniref:hypothetical protein n=1 Tax=Winogradskyella algicola TaxID=2575815 RepID=UPI0011097BEF|nr:hypothetical protein [Winogradskyella algicola]
MRKLLLLVCFCSLCSCATILNGKKDKVYIHAPKNTKVKFKGEDFLVKEDHVAIFPLRSKDTLKFELSNDSISTEFAFPKKTSGTFFLNFLSPYYVGFLADFTNHKRFSYKRNILFEIDSTEKKFFSPNSEPIHFKRNDIFIYTTPLKAIDIFSQPMLTIGAEYFVTDNISVSAEYGTVFTERLGSGRNPKLRLVKDKGRAFRYELKYYNLLSISNNPRVNEYIGIESRFIRYQFNEDISYIRELEEIAFSIDETLVVHKSVNVFNIKYGLNYPIGKNYFIDLYSGFGIRLFNIKNPGRNYNPETDTLNDDRGHFDYRRRNVEGLNNNNHFNFTLGFKFGYKF